MTHTISNKRLTIEKVNEIILKGKKLELCKEAEEAIVKCRKFLDSKMGDIGRPVYGVTTGFGSLCNITIPEKELSQLQHNLVMSHACGTGETVRPEIVKLMLLLKVQSLSYGYSGVQLITVQRLIDMFNNDVLPVVYPRQEFIHHSRHIHRRRGFIMNLFPAHCTRHHLHGLCPHAICRYGYGVYSAATCREQGCVPIEKTLRCQWLVAVPHSINHHLHNALGVVVWMGQALSLYSQMPGD